MSSTFTDRERLEFKYSPGALKQWREAIDAAMLSAGLTPEPRETETELDAKRFAHYLVGNRAFRDNSIIKMEMRAVSGDDPTLDEWRAAIDKSILAAAKDKVLVED